MKAAFLGLGTMGEPMARNILKAGHQLAVYNRTAARAEALVAEGATFYPTPRQAAAEASVVVVCVSDTPDVEEVLLGKNGVIEGAAPGAVVVDMSTISPQAVREFAAALKEKGIGFVDAPVSGGSEGAINGTLAVMAGGEAADLAQAMPVIEPMARKVTHVGESGAGQVAKAVNQIVCGGVYWAVAEGMVLAMKSGLDARKVAEAISGGAADSWVLNYRADNMIDNNYPLGFRVRLHLKDMRIALEAAEQAGVCLPLGGLVRQMENSLMAQGLGDEDLSSLAVILRQMAGMD